MSKKPNIAKCLSSLGLNSCDLKNAFAKINPDIEGYSRSKTYAKVMQIVAERNDIGLTDKERSEFLISSTLLFDLVHTIRDCKFNADSDCDCTCDI